MKHTGSVKQEVLVKRKEGELILTENIQAINYPPLTRLNVWQKEVSAAGTTSWRDPFQCIVIENYANHIVVLVEGVAGNYERAINKVDIACGHVKVEKIAQKTSAFIETYRERRFKIMCVIIKNTRRLEIFRETYKLMNGEYPRVIGKLVNGELTYYGYVKEGHIIM